MDKKMMVKIVVNPTAIKSFSIKFENGKAYLKIIITNINEIYPMLSEIKKQFPIKYSFTLEFNWKNVPSAIKDDKKIKDELIKIFGLGNEFVIDEIDIKKDKQLASIVKNHIEKHGNAPDFNLKNTEKGKKKICNYVRNILGMHKLSDDDAILIVDNMY
jgi:hypothetical protein